MEFFKTPEGGGVTCISEGIQSGGGGDTVTKKINFVGPDR